MALLATLCTFYPNWMFLFQLSMVIDISCHWIHLHASLMQVRVLIFFFFSFDFLRNCAIFFSYFQGRTSHKLYDASENPIMRTYYTSRPVLFGMCAGNEIFYSSLYLLHFTEGMPRLLSCTKYFCLFVCLFVHVV